MAGSFRAGRLFRLAGYALSGCVAAAGASDLYLNKNKLNLLQAAIPDNTSMTPSATPLGSVLPSETKTFSQSSSWDYNWDKREPEFMMRPSEETKDEPCKVKAPPTATRHLILIRHGEFQKEEIDDLDRHLTPLGEEQAALTGKQLNKFSETLKKMVDPNFKFTRIVNSTMTRAIETADIISAELPSDIPRQSTDLLREGSPYPPEPSFGYQKLESKYFQDGAFIEAGFRKFFHRASAKQEKDSYEILVCHANMIRYFVCRALQIHPESWRRLRLHHCSITWVTITPDGLVAVRTIGDSGHIPTDKLTPLYMLT